MKSLKERLEEKIEKDATNRSMRQCSTGHIDLDKAISWYLKVGFESGAASLATLVLELENKLKEISEKEGMCIFGSSYTSDLPEVAFRQGSAYSYSECARTSKEALQSIEKFLGEK